MTRWPTVTSSPTVRPFRPVVACSMERSWMFVRAPTRIGPASPRTTVPYQTLECSPTTTSPSTTAPGATNAEAAMRGSDPSTGPITRRRWCGWELQVLGIPLAEVLGTKLFQEVAEVLRLLLGRLL